MHEKHCVDTDHCGIRQDLGEEIDDGNSTNNSHYHVCNKLKQKSRKREKTDHQMH